MEKLKSGTRFNEVAQQYSEDKARSGVCSLELNVVVYLINILKMK